MVHDFSGDPSSAVSFRTHNFRTTKLLHVENIQPSTLTEHDRQYILRSCRVNSHT